MSNEVVEYKTNRFPSINTGEFQIVPGDSDPTKLLADIPDTQIGTIEYGGKTTPHVKINYVYKRLTEALGVWFFETNNISYMPPDEKGQVEVMVFGVLKAAGLPVGGVPGIGSDKFMPQNVNATVGNTIKTARADAVKDAARFLGLGLNVRDDPKLNALIERRQNTIKTIADDLTNNGKGEEVISAITELAPQALSEDGTFLANLLTEEQLDKVQKGLLSVARR